MEIPGIALVVLMFGFPVVLVAIGDYRRSKYPRGLRLGFSVKLNAWNNRVWYKSGVCTDVDENGHLFAFYETEEERMVAEEYFPDATILRHTDESRFAFKHPSYGCSTMNKNDPRFS